MKPMEEVKINPMQTPIEIALGIDENGHTTARALYDFLEMPSSNFARWAKQNIENNEYYEENADWWGFVIMKNGNECKDYRLTTDFAKHLCMESHSAKGKTARQYFITVEEKAKEMAINRQNLSPTLQMVYALADNSAKIELEQKRQAEQLNRIEQKQEAITEAFTATTDTENFKAWVNKCIGKIAESPSYTNGTTRNIRYVNARSESYTRLKGKWNCNLDDRVARAKGRALENKPNISKAELNAINKLSVIADDKSLKPCYETVIKEMMICYCVNG